MPDGFHILKFLFAHFVSPLLRYFGAWLAFINSVQLLATWLRENKSLDFIRKEEMEREEYYFDRSSAVQNYGRR
jgi:hypothetical protein